MREVVKWNAYLQFDEEFIVNIPNDPIFSIIKICSTTLKDIKWTIKNDSTVKVNDKDYQSIIHSYALVYSIYDSKIIEKSPYSKIEMSQSKSKITQELYTYFKALIMHYEGKQSVQDFHSLTSKYTNLLSTSFSYEFTQGDLKRVQQLINELREEITKSELIQNEHKERLLKRLETLQAEIHKKMSDLDKFWGLIGDAGVVIGKFGNDIKPVVDRIKELVQIVWKTQAKAEELPSSAENPMLPDSSNQGSE